MNPRTRRKPLLALSVAALLLASLSACVDEGEELVVQPDPVRGGPLFDRYVSLGNSITAGFQSGGINDSVQVRAYPVLLAARAGGPFNPPLIRGTGCPQLFTFPLGGAPARTGACVRITNPPFVSNLAVPGERIGDLVRFPTSPDQISLNTLLIGPRTQLEVMGALDPTLVSVWIGNNDALAAALSGNLAAGADSLLTPLGAFQADLAVVVESVDSVIDVEAGREDAILIGVVDPVIAVPLIQPGAFFFLARDPATGQFQGKPVNANCSPVTPLGQPNPLAANMVSFQMVGNANFPEINCDPAAYPVGDPRRGALLLDVQEQTIVRQRVAAYNQSIQAAATSKGWIYVNPNQVLAPFLAYTPGTPNNSVRKCQGLAGAQTFAQFQQAVLESCPVPPALGGAPNLFGTLFSFDAVHPSTSAHQLIANALAALINAKHGTTLPTS